MTERQQIVLGAIREHSTDLADVYECAVQLSGEELIPRRIFLAAHAVRLLMSELPAIFDLPKLTSLPLLSNRVSELEAHWSIALQSACRTDGRWQGEIDHHLRTLLERCDHFFSWRKEQAGMKARLVTDVMRKSDPAAVPLPDVLYKQRASDFLTLYRYFNEAAHFASTHPEEFRTRLAALEQILLDSLHRKPSAGMTAIDAILAEETGNA